MGTRRGQPNLLNSGRNRKNWSPGYRRAVETAKAARDAAIARANQRRLEPIEREREVELIEAAVAEGRVTMCGVAYAAPTTACAETTGDDDE